LQADAAPVSGRRAAQQSAVQQLLSGKKIAAGDLLDGVVTSLQAYGALVDLGNGVQGLLHITQITHERIPTVESVLAVSAMEQGM
jgi:ribosomal protein S1